jgi:hypothetical protein
MPAKIGPIRPMFPIAEQANKDGTVLERIPFGIDAGVKLKYLIVAIKHEGLVGFRISKNGTNISARLISTDNFSIQKLDDPSGDYVIEAIKKSRDTKLVVGFELPKDK